MSLANVFRILLEGRKTTARYARRWNSCSSRPEGNRSESLTDGSSPARTAPARSVAGSWSGRPLRRIQAPRTDGRGRVDVVRPAPASLPATGRGFQPRNTSAIFVRHELDPLEAAIPTVASDSQAARRTGHFSLAEKRTFQLCSDIAPRRTGRDHELVRSRPRPPWIGACDSPSPDSSTRTSAGATSVAGCRCRAPSAQSRSTLRLVLVGRACGKPVHRLDHTALIHR